MDYITLIHTMIDSFINNPEAVLIRELPQENERDKTILICTENDDTARLIGKKGCVANAIREIVAVAGKLENKKVHIKFESFEQDK